MREALAVMAGGALGSLGRWLVAEWVATIPSFAFFPWSTLLVNVAGSFGIGFFSEILLEGGMWNAGSGLRAMIFAGILGGFTTFSAFSLQTVALLRVGEPVLAGVNVLSNVFLCLAAVWFGAVVAQWFVGMVK